MGSTRRAIKAGDEDAERDLVGRRVVGHARAREVAVVVTGLAITHRRGVQSNAEAGLR